MYDIAEDKPGCTSNPQSYEDHFLLLARGKPHPIFCLQRLNAECCVMYIYIYVCVYTYCYMYIHMCRFVVQRHAFCQASLAENNTKHMLKCKTC